MKNKRTLKAFDALKPYLPANTQTEQDIVRNALISNESRARALALIGEILVEQSKCNRSAATAINDIRDVMQKYWTYNL